MLKAYRKSFLIVSLVLLSLIMATGFAFGTLITLDAIEDAGQSPGQVAYIQFQPSGLTVTTANVATQWISKGEVYSYASSKGISGSKWSLTSAGNIWSPDFTVGESWSSTHAGTYRITPVGGAFERDYFGWSTDSGKWWWEMEIQAHNVYENGIIVNYYDYVLGSSMSYSSALDAWNAVQGSFLDINLAEGGWLNFWIYDVNTIDNLGNISVNVTPVPEPSTMLLLSLSLMAILGFRRLTR